MITRRLAVLGGLGVAGLAGCSLLDSPRTDPTPYVSGYKASDLVAVRTPYVGDNNAVSKVLAALKYDREGSFTISLDTDSTPYGLSVTYTQLKRREPDEAVLVRTLDRIALTLALIDNLDGARVMYRADTVIPPNYAMTIAEADAYAEMSIKQAAGSEQSMQRLLDTLASK